MAVPPLFHRSPRLRRQPPTAVITIPAPPPPPAPPENVLAAVLIPPLSALAVVLFMLLTGIGAAWWQALLFGFMTTAMAAVGALATYWFRLRAHRRSSTERVRQFNDELMQLAQQVSQLQEQQRTFSIGNDPAPEACLSIVQRRQRQLWSRMPDDDDFLAVRLGIGSVAASFRVSLAAQPPPDSADPLHDAAVELCQHASRTAGIPVTVALRTTGVLGVAATHPDGLRVASLLAMQLATHHAPDQVRLAAVFPPEAWDAWAWLRWLPHTWNDERTYRFLAADPTAVGELVDQLADLRARQRMAPGAPGDNPWLILFLADGVVAAAGGTLRRLLTEATGEHLCVVVLAERVRQLPPECHAIVRVVPETTEIIYQPGAREQQTQPFTLDVVQPEAFDEFARAMAPIRLAQDHSVGRNRVLTFLDLYGAQLVERLSVAERWRDNARTSGSLAVPIGIAASGKVLSIDLHEKADGPNGLIAGTAGSGKSELLQTLALSLAVNYPPQRVSFVLIDYKGGGTANLLAALPHTIGIITNLQDGNLAQRAILSLRAEAERRQRLFAAAGVNHIDAYQRACDAGGVAEALPYVLIVVDEFAELKTEQPEIAREFVRIARTGRSLGFRLLLAMQKPAGIVDEQIEANMRLRICLRVAQVEDSQAMLRRPDAAYLAGAGSALLQVGVERFERFQVGWGGAPYQPSAAAMQTAAEIGVVALNGSRRVLGRTATHPELTAPTQLEVVVAYLRERAAELETTPVMQIWLPPLPTTIDLEQLREDGGWNGSRWLPHTRWLAPAVGLVDRPEKQRQDKLRVDLAHSGHLAVYGAGRAGKSTLLQTLLTALALDHPPDALHIYVMELGGRHLRGLAGLPHVGGVIGAEDREGLVRLLRMLTDELHRRQQHPPPIGTDAAPVPTIVLAIDAYENLARLGAVTDELSAHIQTLAHDGMTAGIFVVLTANHPAAVPFALSTSLRQTLVLQLAERNDYTLLLGTPVRTLPDAIPGRGIVPGDTPALFQVALPATGGDDAPRAQAQRALIDAMAAGWPGALPPKVPRLPERILLPQLLQPPRTSDRSLVVALGLYVDTLRPAVVDLGELGSALIAGSPRSGKSTLLRTWATALAETRPPEALHFYIVDSGRGSLATLAGGTHVRACTSAPAESEQMLQNLQRLVEERLQAIRHRQPEMAWPSIVVLVDDLLDPFDDGTSDTGKQLLAWLLRQGRRADVHLLAASAVGDVAAKGWNEPVKMLKETQTGFLFGVTEDTVFGLRIPENGNAGALGPGDGFWVSQARYLRVRLALPAA